VGKAVHTRQVNTDKKVIVEKEFPPTTDNFNKETKPSEA
jgi:hypothetical protein